MNDINPLALLNTEQLRQQLQESLDTIERLNKTLQITQHNYNHDINLIGEELIKQAEDRDWCSVFDEVIEELNESLHNELPTRARVYEVEVTVTETRTQTVTFEVTAKSKDEAYEIAENESDYTTHLNEWDWDVEDSDMEVISVGLA